MGQTSAKRFTLVAVPTATGDSDETKRGSVGGTSHHVDNAVVAWRSLRVLGTSLSSSAGGRIRTS